MRILLIHNYYQYYGGEDTYYDSLAKLLKNKKNEVYEYTKSSKKLKNNLSEKIRVAGGLFINPQVRKELENIVKSFSPEIAHINNLFPLISPVAYDVCKENNIPIVQTMHTFRYLCPKGTLFRNGKICELCVNKKFAYPSILYDCYHNSALASATISASFFYHNIREKLKQSDKIIFPSEQAREYHVKHLNLKREKTAVIPNFIFIPKYMKKQKSDYFIYAGRFSEEKNIVWLLKIFSGLPQFKLIVVGDGPLVNEVIEYKKYSNIEIKINIPKREVFELLSGAICTIIPSAPHFEFGPLVMIESFACDTPVLVPKGGVFLDKVKERKTGFFYDTNNQVSIINQINNIHAKRKQLNILTKYVRREFEKNYTSDKHYEKIHAIYSNVLRNKGNIF